MMNIRRLGPSPSFVAAALGWATLLIAPDAATSQIEAFRHRLGGNPVGRVYHYEKTNHDGSVPEKISLRIAAVDRIEAFKFHPGEEPAGLVAAEMDWTRFSVRNLSSFQVFADGSRKLFAAFRYDPAVRSVTVDIPAIGRLGEVTPISREPWHVYNFDLASLNVAMPHLVDPQGTFVIGIADPNFGDGPLFSYRGEVEIRYLGDEQRRGSACRKYRIDGTGLADRGGFLWTDRQDGMFVDAEIDLPDNPDWTSFKLRRLGVERMDDAAWLAFQKAALSR